MVMPIARMAPKSSGLVPAALKRQRLDRCYIRVNGKLRPASWAEALDTIAAKHSGLLGSRIAAIAGARPDGV